MGYEGLIGETITMRGHNSDAIEAYHARPLGLVGVPGVVVIHHMPGWDEWTKEVTRRLAHHGYAAVAPHLFSRLGRGRGTISPRLGARPGACRMRRCWATCMEQRVCCARSLMPPGKLG